MNKFPLVIVISIFLLSACGGRENRTVRKALAECEACYTGEDTSSRWTAAIGNAERLARGFADPAVWGELYYQKACYDISRGTGDSCHAYLRRSLAYFSKAADDDGIAKLSLTLAQYYNMTEHYDSACLMTDYGLRHVARNDSLRALLYAEKTASFVVAGRMDSAVRVGPTALRMTLEAGDTASFITTSGNVGIAYRRSLMNDSAAACYRAALDMAQRQRDYAGMAYMCNNLAVLYAEAERYADGAAFARRAVGYARQCADDMEYYSALANEGAILSKQGDNRRAATVLRRVVAEAEGESSMPLQLKAINHLLNAYLEMGKTDSAEIYLRKGERLAAALPPNSIAAVGISESKANLQMKRGNYRGALATLAWLDSVAATGNNAMPRYKLLLQEARCHAGLGDYRQAFRLALDAMAMADTVRNRTAESRMSEYAVKFRTQEKELEISRLTQENLQHEAMMSRVVTGLVAVIVVLGMAVLLLLYHRKMRRQQTEILMVRNYIDGMEGERARLARELHDGVCNDLLALGLELRSDRDSASDVARKVETIRENLRHISHELMPPSFKHVELDELLNDYLSHLVVPDTLTVEYRSEGGNWGSLPHNVAYELYRITQEAVSNIIKHSGATRAEVVLCKENGVLSLMVKDNSRGIPSRRDGVGLRSMRDRAHSIGAEYASRSGEGGSEMTIKLKYTENG